MGLFYSSPDELVVEHAGELVDRLPCERIPLEYPGLTGRGEACMGRTQDGAI